MKTVRLKDVAQACGVSVATVSRALNGQADETKPLTEMICRKAGEMGYVQNAAAFTLKTNRSSNIGILYEDQMHHEFFSALLNGLRRQATARGNRAAAGARSRSSRFSRNSFSIASSTK